MDEWIDTKKEKWLFIHKLWMWRGSRYDLRPGVK